MESLCCSAGRTKSLEIAPMHDQTTPPRRSIDRVLHEASQPTRLINRLAVPWSHVMNKEAAVLPRI